MTKEDWGFWRRVSDPFGWLWWRLDSTYKGSIRMEPALTAKEWREYIDRWKSRPKEPASVAAHHARLAHGLAAQRLYGQDFGFRREDAKAVRFLAETSTDLSPDSIRLLESLADRIEALLPPMG